MTKYAPANDAGDKPYLVMTLHWSRYSNRIVFAPNSREAKFTAKNQQRDTYVLDCRRATPIDLEIFGNEL